VSQDENEQQLRIWKDLAISKQLLMNEAASALKLEDDFGADELREALNHAIKRARDADADIAAARNRASEEVANMQAEVKKTEKARKEAESQRDKALEEKQGAEASLETGRNDNSDAAAKLLAAYRSLVEWADDAASKSEELEAAPKAEGKLLSDIETSTGAADEEDNGKKNKKNKREVATA